jgi:energy-coupling factor transporter ATP-binding protein EcfA2
LELFKQLNQDIGMTFLFATHSNHVAGYAERSVELLDGMLLGQHGKDIDLSSLDLSRMVIMDSDNRITLPENVLEQMNSPYGSLWNVNVIDGKKILMTPMEVMTEEQTRRKTSSGDQKDCPVCGVLNPMEGKFCVSCGAKF